VRRILFVANGHGETAIAARLGRAVRERLGGEHLVADLFPLVGDGSGCAGELRVVGPTAMMPSGGLVAMGNVRAFARDLGAGFVPLWRRQVRFARDAGARYDALIAVGDVYALGMTLLSGRRPIFVGTAKSAYVAPYGPFERTLLRRARAVFVRDEVTARMLRDRRVDAVAPGNAIVDLVEELPPAVAEPALGLLPGSRAEAYADAVRLARVARELAARGGPAVALLSLAPTLDGRRMAAGLAADGWDLVPGREPGVRFVARSGGARLLGWEGPFGALLAASAVTLGQAGTANEQAAAAGLPVVALASRASGRTDWYRMRQRRLLGEALLLVPQDPAEAAEAIAALGRDPIRRARMGATGRERMGRRGGAAEIARVVAESLA